MQQYWEMMASEIIYGSLKESKLAVKIQHYFRDPIPKGSSSLRKFFPEDSLVLHWCVDFEAYEPLGAATGALYPVVSSPEWTGQKEEAIHFGDWA